MKILVVFATQFFINELEKKYQDLKKCRLNRTLTEFYFTSKGYLCKYIFELHNHIDIITYIDSDLYFFSNPSSLFDELRGYSVGITKHNFHWSTIYFLKYGKYNAGWITFRKDENGLKCLNDWIREIVIIGVMHMYLEENTVTKNI